MLTFQELYETYAAEVYRFAFWLVRDPSEAEDITSETFIRAWTSKNPIRTETLKAYLFTIARNYFLDQRRKTRVHNPLPDGVPDPGPGPEQQVETQLELDHIQRVLERLPEMDRTAFILRVDHGLPYREIARVLGLSLPAAKVKVHRIRKKLLGIGAVREETSL